MLHLKQSTAVTVRVGPFLSQSDGYTIVSAGSITQAETRLSKAHGAFAQKNDATAGTHDEFGWWLCVLDATDTGTLGPLVISFDQTALTSLPVWHEYEVLPANVYDSLYSTDKLQVDVVESSTPVSVVDVSGDVGGNVLGNVNGSTGSVTGAVGSVTGAVGSVTGAVGSVVGHTPQTGDTFALANGASGFVATNTVVDSILVDTGTTLPASFVTTDALITTVDTVVDAIQATVDGDSITISSISGETAAILVDTGTTLPGTLSSMDTKIDAVPASADIATAVWDQSRTAKKTAGTFGEALQSNILRTGTAQAATSTTIQLDSSASSQNDTYNNAVVMIVEGTGAGQFRRITDYTGSTVTATVDAAWATTPSTDSLFSLAAPVVVSQILTSVITADSIATDAIGSAEIAAGAIESDAFATGAITNDAIAAGAITSTEATSVGAAASVTGSVGSVAGNVDGSVASVTGAVGSVTGAVGSVAGNVDGSVASVTGAVGSVTGSVGSVTALATDSVNADALAADAVAEIAAGATSANVSVAPLTVGVNTLADNPEDVELYQDAASPTIVWTVVDANGDAVDLSAATLRLNVVPVGSDTASWTLATGGSGLVVGGASSNQVTATYSTTNTATLGRFTYWLWNITSDEVLKTGNLGILDTVKTAAV